MICGIKVTSLLSLDIKIYILVYIYIYIHFNKHIQHNFIVWINFLMYKPQSQGLLSFSHFYLFSHKNYCFSNTNIQYWKLNLHIHSISVCSIYEKLTSLIDDKFCIESGVILIVTGFDVATSESSLYSSINSHVFCISLFNNPLFTSTLSKY